MFEYKYQEEYLRESADFKFEKETDNINKFLDRMEESCEEEDCWEPDINTPDDELPPGYSNEKWEPDPPEKTDYRELIELTKKYGFCDQEELVYKALIKTHKNLYWNNVDSAIEVVRGNRFLVDFFRWVQKSNVWNLDSDDVSTLNYWVKRIEGDLWMSKEHLFRYNGFANSVIKYLIINRMINQTMWEKVYELEKIVENKIDNLDNLPMAELEKLQKTINTLYAIIEERYEEFRYDFCNYGHMDIYFSKKDALDSDEKAIVENKYNLYDCLMYWVNEKIKAKRHFNYYM